MGTNVTTIASVSITTNKNATAKTTFDKINPDDTYGTFNELVAELSKLGKAGKKEKYKEKGWVTKYYDANGNFVGGTYTRPEKDGKYTGTVTIGTVTYTAEDIKKEGLVKSIFDSKKGIYAKDQNDNGKIDHFEVFNFGPPNLK